MARLSIKKKNYASVYLRRFLCHCSETLADFNATGRTPKKNVAHMPRDALTPKFSFISNAKMNRNMMHDQDLIRLRE